MFSGLYDKDHCEFNQVFAQQDPKTKNKDSKCQSEIVSVTQKSKDSKIQNIFQHSLDYKQTNIHSLKENQKSTGNKKFSRGLVWTKQENQQLLKYHEQLGSRWSQISAMISSRYRFKKFRTFSQTKNHFHSILRMGLRKINLILKNHKIKYKYPSIRQKFLVKLNSAMEDKFTRKLNLSENIIQMSYSIRNWISQMSDHSFNQLKDIKSFENGLSQLTQLDNSFRKHKRIKSKDNGNLRNFYQNRSKLEGQKLNQKSKGTYQIIKSGQQLSKQASIRFIKRKMPKKQKFISIISLVGGQYQNQELNNQISDDYCQFKNVGYQQNKRNSISSQQHIETKQQMSGLKTSNLNLNVSGAFIVQAFPFTLVRSEASGWCYFSNVCPQLFANYMC